MEGILWLCLLQAEGERMTVWVKVNLSVCAWLECMCLQMSEPLRKRDTVVCGCVMWVRLGMFILSATLY